jgi:hypothetical protein
VGGLHDRKIDDAIAAKSSVSGYSLVDVGVLITIRSFWNPPVTSVLLVPKSGRRSRSQSLITANPAVAARLVLNFCRQSDELFVLQSEAERDC